MAFVKGVTCTGQDMKMVIDQTLKWMLVCNVLYPIDTYSSSLAEEHMMKCSFSGESADVSSVLQETHEAAPEVQGDCTSAIVHSLSR